MTAIPHHGELVWVAHADLRPGPNPRRTFEGEELAALAESIAAQGLLQNLVVTAPFDDRDAANGVRIIVAGERRFRAIGLLIAQGRWQETRPIPCRLVEADPGTIRALALLENLQRQDVPPLEEAEAFRDLHAMDGERWSVAAIAAAIGRTPRYVQQRIAVATKLAPEAKALLADGKLTFTQARELVTLPPKAQKTAADDAAWKMRAAGEAVTRKAIGSMFNLKLARFDRALYTGEVYETEDGLEYAVDRKAAMALQEAWAKARAAEIGGAVTRAGAWFEPGRGHWRDGWKYAETAAEKKRAVTLICIDTSDGNIEEFPGVIAMPKAKEGEKPGKAAHDAWQKEREAHLARQQAQHAEADTMEAAVAAMPAEALFSLLAAMPACATREIAAHVARQVRPYPRYGQETTPISPSEMLLARLLGVAPPAWVALDDELEADEPDDTEARAHLAALDAGTFLRPETPRLLADAIARGIGTPAPEQPSAATACAVCGKPTPRARCHYATCPAKAATAAEVAA